MITMVWSSKKNGEELLSSAYQMYTIVDRLAGLRPRKIWNKVISEDLEKLKVSKELKLWS